MRTLAIAWILAATVGAFAQSPSGYVAYTGTDYKALPSPPSLGAANTTHMDETFNSEILRVTDQNTNGGQSFISTDAGEHRAWNANSTAIKLTGPHGDGWWIDFNPGTFRVGAIHAVPLSLGATWEWSVTDPDLIWVLRSNQIASYNKATGAITGIGGPSTGEAVAYMAVGVGEDNWVCAAAGAGQQDTWNKIFCIQPSNPSSSKLIDLNAKTINGAVQSDPNWPNTGVGIHSLAGGTGDRWISLTFRNANWSSNGNAVFNLSTNTWSLIRTQLLGGDIFWGGHVSMGNGTFANGAGNQGGQDSRGILLRNPDDLMNQSYYRFVGQPAPPYNGWCDAEHNTWFNSGSNPTAPIFDSRYGGNSGCAFAWTGEIIGVATDNSNTVWRFAHNYNSGACYYGQSFAQVSNDGRWIVFSSTWGGQLGADTAFGCGTRIDTFVVRLTPDTPAPSTPVLAWTQQPTTTVNGATVTPAFTGTLQPAPSTAHTLALAVPVGGCIPAGSLTTTTNTTTGAWSFNAVTVSAGSVPANCTFQIADQTNGAVTALLSNSFNVVAAAETVTMTVSPPCTLQGTTTVPVSGGVWAFPGVTVHAPSPPSSCTTTITDSDSSVPPIISPSFMVLANAPAVPVLAFTAQPTDTVTGMTITPAIAGTLTPPSARLLQASVGAAGNCNLSGTMTTSTDASTGAWSFAGILASAVAPPASCTVLIHDTSASNSAVDIVSNPFNVTPGGALPTVTLTWVSEPTTTASGELVTPRPSLMVTPIPPLGQPGISVTLQVTSGTCSFTGSMTVTSEAAESSGAPGMATFSLTANAQGTNCVVTASAPNAMPVASTSFGITAPATARPLLTVYPVPFKP